MNLNKNDNENVNSSVHRKFLQSINSLNNVQHIQKPTRREAVVSKKNEFNLGKGSNIKSSNISVVDIFNVLKSSNQHIGVAKALRNARNTKKVLKKSLPKQVEEKIQRSVGYEQAKKKLNKWDVIVTSNQAATTQVFPNDFESNEDFTISDEKKFKSDLMLEMEALNNEMKILQSDGNNEGKLEDKPVKGKLTNQMSKEEIIAHRKELAYLRIQYSQNCAKARKQNKIKSKSYHKFLKRDKIAAKVKEIALLEKTNPESAIEKLENAEKRRALERASLRHRNTSVWAKALQVRAKNDKEIKKDLSEQLALSRQLTQKVNDNNSSDSEVEANDSVNDNKEETNFDPFNPWIKVPEKLKKDEVLLGYRKYWFDRNKNEKDLDDYRNLKVDENRVIASTEWEETPIEIEDKVQSEEFGKSKHSDINIDKIFNDANINLKKKNNETLNKLNDDFLSNESTIEPPQFQNKKDDSNFKRLSFKKTKSKIEIDEELIETPSKDAVGISSTNLREVKDISIGNESLEIDPNKFSENIVKVSKYIDLHTGEKGYNLKDTIAAAFEDDDLIDDFKKEQEIKNTENENILELNTPGWGSWVSAENINDKTPKRMILKFPGVDKKKECNEGQLYIKNDVENKHLKQHLVSSLPFPFKSVQEYEASIRAPLGRSFVPETAFKLLTRPSVITKKGKIINPIDESILKSGIKKRKNIP